MQPMKGHYRAVCFYYIVDPDIHISNEKSLNKLVFPSKAYTLLTDQQINGQPLFSEPAQEI